MRCPGCGYVSFDILETCTQCGAPMVASGTRGAPEAARGPATETAGDGLPDDLQSLRLETPAGGATTGRPDVARRRRPRPARAERVRSAGGEASVALPAADALPVGDEDLQEVLARGTAASAERDDGPEFRIDEELFPDAAPVSWAERSEGAPLALEPAGGGEWSSPLPDPDGPGLLLEEEGSGWEGAPIIDRDEEVPERFWAPEVAGLGRRGLALLVDHALLGALLGVFFFGACAALRLSGTESDPLLAAAGLQAASLPFALLALLLSLVYHVYFHGRDGRTPGKALAGVEVRSRDGSVPSLGRAVLRWFAAALGVSCAGAGIAWALFHPRRCGWADLLSATLVAERRRAAPEALRWR